MWLKAARDEYDLPVYSRIMEQYSKFTEDIRNGRVVSAYALDRHGVVSAVSKMAFGNKLGVTVNEDVSKETLFAPGFGNIVAEVPAEKVGQLSITYTVIGEVTADGKFSYGNAEITLDEAYKAWTGTLEKVFKTTSGEENDGPVAMAVKTADPEATYENGVYNTKNIYVASIK